MASLERPRVEYRTPEDLVREVGRGDVRIPHFQRSFRWEAADIVRLFDSILQGFPVPTCRRVCRGDPATGRSDGRVGRP